MAASKCKPDTDREAALIGAIASTLIETGQVKPSEIAAVAANNMAEMYRIAQCFEDPTLPDRMFPPAHRGYPKAPEINRALAKWRDQYDPPVISSAWGNR